MLCKSTFFTAAAAVFAAGSVVAQDLTINTIPSLIQCQPALISWKGGKAPYYLAAIPGGDPGGAALENFPQQDGTSYTWTVDLDPGTSVTIKITDSTGQTNYNDKVTIQQGSTSDCKNDASSGGAGGNSTAPATGSNSTGSTDAAAGSAPSGSTGSGSTPSGGSGNGSGSPSNSPSGNSPSGAAAQTGATKPSGGSSGSPSGSATPTGSSASSNTSGAARPLAVLEKSTPFLAALGAVAAFFA